MGGACQASCSKLLDFGSQFFLPRMILFHGFVLGFMIAAGFVIGMMNGVGSLC